MLNSHQYSIAICPPYQVVEQVRALKQELRAYIGWFSAVGAEAHISFDIMVLDENKLEQCRQRLGEFALQQQPVEVTCTAFSHFKESRTIFIAPDSVSEAGIKQLFAAYRVAMGPIGALQNIHPHITIGKGLKPEQFRRAITIFEGRTCHLHFTCHNIALRRFNGRQYDILERWTFGE